MLLVVPRGNLQIWASCVSLTEGDPVQGKILGRPECPQINTAAGQFSTKDGQETRGEHSNLLTPWWQVLECAHHHLSGVPSQPVPSLPFIPSLCHFRTPSPCYQGAPPK